MNWEHFAYTDDCCICGPFSRHFMSKCGFEAGFKNFTKNLFVLRVYIIVVIIIWDK